MGTGTYFSQKFWPDSLLRQIDDELFARKAWEGVADIREEFRSFVTFRVTAKDYKEVHVG